MVDTWEVGVAGIPSPTGTYASLAEASAALPAGSYTTLRTYGGDRLLRLDQHRRRLEDSLPVLARLDPTRLAAGLRRVLDDAAARRRAAPIARESRLRLTFSPPRLFISIAPFAPPSEALYREGVRCVTVPVRRDNPRAKSTAFIGAAARASAALPPGVEEGLMVAPDGSLLEGLSSNFFAVVEGALRAEEQRVLPGVTRSLILELAAQDAMPVRLQAVSKADLPRVTECFITSVSREILPVVRIDADPIGDGRPGPVARRLFAAFRALVGREAATP